jgi:hypothetical protein
MWAEPTTTRHLFGSLSTDRLSEIFAKLSGPSGKNPKSIILKNLRKSSAGVVKVGARFRSSKEIAMASKFEPIPDSNGQVSRGHQQPTKRIVRSRRSARDGKRGVAARYFRVETSPATPSDTEIASASRAGD